MNNKFNNKIDKDFAWKVRWRMKHDKNPLFTIMSDKYKVKEYAKKLDIKTAKLLYVTDNPTSIPFNKLPNNYFIKANHASRWNIACIDSYLYMFGYGDDLINKNGDFISKKYALQQQLSQKQTISICEQWLKTDYSKDEWGYQNIERKIVVEEMLQSRDSKNLKDYRLFTFNGKVEAINVDSSTYRHDDINYFFDRSWKPFNLSNYINKDKYKAPLKPEMIDIMLNIAHKLGKDIDFLRIDLFDTVYGVFLSEITMYPSGGDKGTPSSCPKFNKWLGDCWI